MTSKIEPYPISIDGDSQVVNGEVVSAEKGVNAPQIPGENLALADMSADAIIDEYGHLAPDTPAPPRKTRYELPGIGKGRVNDENQPVTPQTAQRGLSKEAIDHQDRLNKHFAALGKEALKNSNPPSFN